MSTNYFARWTDDPQGDLARTWCYQPSDAAGAALPWRECSREEIEAEGFDPDEIEWTGANWATREQGIPGLLIDEIDDPETADDAEILAAVPATPNISAYAGVVLAVYEGTDEGDEYESTITSSAARRFTPLRLVRSVQPGEEYFAQKRYA